MDAVDDGSPTLFQFQSPHPPAEAASAMTTTTPTRSNSLGKPKTQGKRSHKSAPKPPPILPILSAAATTAQCFVTGNGARMLPSQLVDFQRQLDSLSLPVQIPSSLPD
ncbi:unnamed protein product [Linum tenue]|uniref:Uncharacterized protein n=1 Tax=Linum tenue TaxID=586396 RepID=A0AAV0HYB5_9ROSI|nr:unnamed protein product [Linum tenue]